MKQVWNAKYMIDADMIEIDASGKKPPKFKWKVEPNKEEIIKGIGNFIYPRVAIWLLIFIVSLGVLIQIFPNKIIYCICHLRY